ncbi:hypothetical protein V9T40_005896 [Parthenolecanium corni]|uniref:BZIP domain-containing protein n=1 Tax=Parthenolecanium corni TaxID=536013 RepID=A0AAN9TTD6_9HEMI
MTWVLVFDKGGIEEALKVEDDCWSAEGLLDVKPQVVLHDRLMSDAVLGGNGPIKSEHSYCTRMSNTDDDNSDDSNSTSLHKMQDDINDECYPAISLKLTGDQNEQDSSTRIIMIKDEPMSECESPPSSCPPSPTMAMPSHRNRSEKRKAAKQESERSRNGLASRNGLISQQSSRLIMPHLNIKIESNSTGFSLPPTPPSSTSSDSETGNVSPERPSSSPARRLFLSSTASSTRQPIQTPLISSQPKGSTGVLMLTEEEKRTLLAEGYPIPTRLPLSKAEEKSLKKIRRKIKNKISAQESRRKKKEYMDGLERKVEVLSSQNVEYKKRINSLEDSNSTLVSQVQKLQEMLGLRHLPTYNGAFVSIA